MIVGLMGKMGAGKNEAAKGICPPFKEWAFSRALRLELWQAATYNEWPVELPEALRADAAELTRDPAAVYSKPTSEPARRLLQWWGTEYRRTQDPEYWIRRVAARVQDGEHVCLTDLRFANEATWVQQRGGIVVKIRRGWWADVSGHSSETELDTVLPNYTIDNDGSPQRLWDRLRAIREIAEVAG